MFNRIFALAPHLVITQFSSVALEAGFYGVPSAWVLVPGAGAQSLHAKKGYRVPALCAAGGAGLASHAEAVAKLLDRSLETSGQLAIRLAVVMVFALGALAASLGLDLLLGGFVAGVIARIALKGREVEVLESKLSAVGYGFLIPFFFVVK